MQIRMLSLAEVTDEDVQAWHRPALHAAEPTMYLDPRFLVPARGRGAEAADLRLVVAQDGGEWLAALDEVVARPGVEVLERRRSVAAFAPRDRVTVLPVPEGPGPVVDPPLSWDHMPTDERRNMRRGVRGLVRETDGPLELHDLSTDPGGGDAFVALQARAVPAARRLGLVPD